MTNSMQKKQRHQIIFSRDFVNRRILESDWTRGKPGYIQPKWQAQMLPSLDHHLPVKNLRCQFIVSCNLIGGTLGSNQPTIP